RPLRRTVPVGPGGAGGRRVRQDHAQARSLERQELPDRLDALALRHEQGRRVAAGKLAVNGPVQNLAQTKRSSLFGGHGSSLDTYQTTGRTSHLPDWLICRFSA